MSVRHPLICFDMDGTIECIEDKSEYISGPVKISTLCTLANYCEVFIVSPSPYFPKHDDGTPMFHISADYGSDTMRHVNLLRALGVFIEAHKKSPSIKLYVSNNGDWKEAQKAGFIYVDAQMFANGFETIIKPMELKND